jgi:uncharacterized protein
MQFTNEAILSEQLPTVETVPFQPLEKSYRTVLKIVYCISTIVVLIIGIVLFLLIKPIQTATIIYSSAAVFVLLTIWGWISMTISFKFSGYALRQHDLLYKSGWLKRKTKAVPVKRIQHVSVQSGPIERKYGLASISIYTAGSEAADFTISGITRERAEMIKDWIAGK